MMNMINKKKIWKTTGKVVNMIISRVVYPLKKTKFCFENVKSDIQNEPLQFNKKYFLSVCVCTMKSVM